MAKFSKASAAITTKTPKVTSQTTPTPGTVKNNAGGYVYEIDKWDRLDRFLILGTDGATMYCTQHKMALDNAKNVVDCVAENGTRTVQKIVEISDSGRAPKNDPALFALAICASQGDLPTRRLALDSLPKVARIGTHLFQFAHYVDGLRGWGSGLRNAFSNWYNGMTPDRLALQVVKYPQRTAEEGNAKSAWSHSDLLRKCHAHGDELHNMIYNYVTKDGELPKKVPESLSILEGANKIKGQTNANIVAKIVEEYQLPHELVPKEVANDPKVWAALLPNMPLGATLRTLNRMTSYGVLKPLSSELKTVIARLTNPEAIKKARIHPIAVLAALKTYAQGRGIKGSLTWTPIQQINDALDEMLYMAFDAIEPSGKNIMLALDVSGSMSMGSIGGLEFVTPREGTAVMALATARSEKNYHIVGFSTDLIELKISPRMRLDGVLKVISGLPFSGTDCSLPMVHASKHKLDVDGFFVYTDNETWAGDIKPAEALRQYRNQRKPEAKLVVCGMTGTPFSIADPNDPGMMDCVGFDTSAPAVMSDFIKRPLRTK